MLNVTSTQDTLTDPWRKPGLSAGYAEAHVNPGHRLRWQGRRSGCPACQDSDVRLDSLTDVETRTMMKIRSGAVIVGLCAGWALGVGQWGQVLGAEEKLRVLIVDGQNNHNWRAMTPPMKAELEGSGRFTVDVATTPGPRAKPSAWDAFHPDFARYDVVLSNYNGEPWPAEVRKALEDYVANGGGLAIIHAANNAFPDWPAFN